MDAGALPSHRGRSEQDLLRAARAGDEDAFRRLIEPYSRRLHAHCYRMMGSLYDADDALQDTILSAWRGLGSFDGRSQLSTWLYRIATNASLNAIKKRSRRVLPAGFGYRSEDPRDAAEPPVLEPVWLEPYPDVADDDETADPEARYAQRESLELAFVAAVQQLPANQRAALILCEVLGFSAKEAAETLDTTTTSVSSALQRARRVLDERRPQESQQATLRALGDEELAGVVDGYVAAMEQGDVGAVVAMLTEDASWSMPPQRAWFEGHRAIAAFLTENPFKYFRWRLLPARANGQAAAGSYSWDDSRGTFVAHGLNVLELRGDRIAAVTTFLDVSRRGAGGPSFLETRLLERFGLPSELPA